MSKFRAGLRRRPKSREIEQVSFRKGDTICNLCREKHNLTYDHIPPQCCGNDQDVVAQRIYADELVAQQVDARSRNGLKYRTLCSRCNSELLGGWDEALGAWTKAVEGIVNPSLHLPDSVTFQVRGGAVVRSVLGHMVAATTKTDEVTTDQKIRDYLVGGATLDPAVKLYCWLYPYRPIVVARDFTFVEVEGEGGKSPGLVSVIKFYPLAFCLIDGAGSLQAAHLTTLHEFAACVPSDEVEVRLWRRPQVEAGWPERAKGNHIVLGGATYVDAVTTFAPDRPTVTPGRRLQAERWEGGDNTAMRDLHAFVKIPDA